MGRIAVVCYRAQRGAEDALHALCASHYAKLYVLGFVTRRLPVFFAARDGCVVQVLDWKSQDVIDAAGKHAAVLELRRAYAAVSELVPLTALPEAAAALALFEPAPFTVELPPFHKLVRAGRDRRLVGILRLERWKRWVDVRQHFDAGA